MNYFKLHSKKILFLLAIGLSTISFTSIDELFLVSKNLSIFTSIYKEINLNYADDVNTTKLIQTGIHAMLHELDPYTKYVPQSEMENFRLTFVNPEYDGIGTITTSQHGKLLIAQVFENFPAQKADIRVGDEILEVNNISLKEKSLDEVRLLLKGGENTSLQLLINRMGNPKPIKKTLIRTKIKQSNIPYYGLLANQIGYIALDRFQIQAGQEVMDALVDLQKNKLNGLILDLRDNGGGRVDEAVKIINLFIKQDTEVAILKGRHPTATTSYQTTANPLEPNLPLIILINANTASASEIVAGALQDLDRAIIIGQRSFGKGLIQETIQIPYDNLLKITTAKYYTPSGRCIQALNYAQKDSNGHPDHFANSLTKEYQTRAKRFVYDGNGVYPDILVPVSDYHDVTNVLIENFIFDYATKFRSENKNIPPAAHFKLSDIAYQEFINYLSSKDYHEESPLETRFHALVEQAKNEDQFESLETELEALKIKISHHKKNNLNECREEIKAVLENEIVGRYYFERGRFEHNFSHDPDLKEALKIISDKASMSSILAGLGNYKYIGKAVSKASSIKSTIP